MDLEPEPEAADSLHSLRAELRAALTRIAELEREGLKVAVSHDALSEELDALRARYEQLLVDYEEARYPESVELRRELERKEAAWMSEVKAHQESAKRAERLHADIESARAERDTALGGLAMLRADVERNIAERDTALGNYDTLEAHSMRTSRELTTALADAQTFHDLVTSGEIALKQALARTAELEAQGQADCDEYRDGVRAAQLAQQAAETRIARAVAILDDPEQSDDMKVVRAREALR